ncbi:MAG: alkylated DNA repair dioxygenase AlkB [Candidatus Deianiraeaceae bacterium]|jgi:alkylated DNA repair dioxygenase AlkB
MNLLQNEIPLIQGLTYTQNFITEEKEQQLISEIDKQLWLNDLKRRVQHYGYKYNYKARKITPDLKIGEIPQWLQILSNFDQVIVNEYLCGQGITPHIDCISCFSNAICSLSLLETCEMVFEKDNIKHSIILEPRSLLILQDEARYKWKHSIPQKKSNIKNRRVSITLRKVIL